MSCNHPQPGLCKVLGLHILGGLWKLWESPTEKGEKYRIGWCENAGVDLEDTRSKYSGGTVGGPIIAKPPSLITKGWSLAKALKDFASDGLKLVDADEYKKRLDTCNSCNMRDGRSCQICGCNVDLKAKGRAFACPIGKWGETAKRETQPDWAVGITTAPRRKPTLKQSVESCHRAGFVPTVYAEPGTNIDGVNASIMTRPFLHGPHRNWMQTIRDLVQHNPQAKWVAIFQDDALFCKGTRKFLDEMPWPGEKTGVVSLYCPDDTHYEEEGFVGCKRVAVRDLNGAVAMVFPMVIAKRIADSPKCEAWAGHPNRNEVPEKKSCIDRFIGQTMSDWELDVYVYDPGMVQHIGATSTIYSDTDETERGGRKFRKSLKWPGEDVSPFDTFEDKRPKHPIDVVIPGVDSLDLTEKCLEHLAKSEGVDLHVIYVDNGSESGVLAGVEEKAAELELMFTGIRNPENTGFTMATNQGLALATGDVLLLNNDCFVEPATVATLRRHLHADQKMAAVGPLTADKGAQSIVGRAELRSRKGEDKTLSRGSVAFFCTLIKKNALGHIGLLSGEYVYRNLGSDDEWCVRAKKAGWKIGLSLDAFAEHKHTTTFGRLGIDRGSQTKAAHAALKGKPYISDPQWTEVNHSLSYYGDKIANKQPFSFLRLGDGEWNAIVANGKTTGSKSQVFTPELRSAMANVAASGSPAIYATRFGIFAGAAKEWLNSAGNKREWHNAAVFAEAYMDRDISGFLDPVNSHDGRVILVGPDRMKGLDVIRFDKVIVTKEKNNWDDYDEIIGSIRDCAKDGDIFLFAAGPTAKVLIHELATELPKCWLIDIGSFVDPFCGPPTRGHQRGFPASEVKTTNRMEFSHTVITRFNLARDPGKNENEEWLKKRLLLLERFTYPSLVGQTNQDFEWLILCDITTPEFVRSKLQDLADGFPSMRVEYFDSSLDLPEEERSTGNNGWMDRADPDVLRRLIHCPHEWIITTRLDSDDAVHETFIESIQSHALPKKELLNIKNGYRWAEGRVAPFAHKSNPFLSLVELSSELKTVFHNSHGQITDDFPVRHIENGNLWMIVCHSGNVSNRLGTRATSVPESDASGFQLNVKIPFQDVIEVSLA